MRCRTAGSGSPAARVTHAASLFAAGEVQTLEQVERLAELVIVILRAWRVAASLTAAGTIGAAIAVAQVTGQIGLAQAFRRLLAGQLRAGHLDVRLDALGLDGAAVGRVVERRGQFERAVVVQWQYGLHRALAEAVGAQHHGSLLILLVAWDHVRGGGAVAIDQHLQRDALAGIGRVGVEAQLGTGNTTLGIDVQAAAEEVVGYPDGGMQYPARM